MRKAVPSAPPFAIPPRPIHGGWSTPRPEAGRRKALDGLRVEQLFPAREQSLPLLGIKARGHDLVACQAAFLELTLKTRVLFFRLAEVSELQNARPPSARKEQQLGTRHVERQKRLRARQARRVGRDPVRQLRTCGLRHKGFALFRKVAVGNEKTDRALAILFADVTLAAEALPVFLELFDDRRGLRGIHPHCSTAISHSFLSSHVVP